MSMHRRVVQATATAVIFASMALPVFAQGNGHSKALGISMKLEGQHDNGLHLGWLKNGKHDDHEDDEDEQKSAIALCLETARKAHDVAIKAAAKTYRTAQADARSAYNLAVKTAQKAHKTALKDARATFKASAKDQAAIEVYAAARIKAGTDWTAAMKAAKDAFSTAKINAEKTWKEAKKKADADFKAAKLACAPAPTPAPTPADATAPAAVSLSLSAATNSSILVSWTAPGDDGSTGTAASYDLRYSTSAITDANFASATQVTGEPTPAVAGTAQTMTVTGLTANTAYFFAMKSQDEVPNVSTLSNVPTLSTTVAADVTAPAAVTLGLSAATSSSLLLTWNAPGDDGSTGTAASYDVRYSTAAITDANFASATQVTGEPTPAVAGTTQTLTVSGLSASTTYYFAMKSQDEVPNVSALSNVPSLATLAPGDTTAPAAITTLSLSGATSSSITLTWIATGDDALVGTAASYDVRYSTSPITTDAQFTAATQATGEPAPAVAGLTQSMTVSGLTAGTTYYFAIEASDEASNTSSLSNVPVLATL
ncbi:MAG TPA: fibronectin type III domain-containing protein [Candidatus Eisenbacteria bacterium]|nr:fibronectin type III domain-containing protein [Candidatus Eisenbacteria bacterium]